MSQLRYALRGGESRPQYCRSLSAPCTYHARGGRLTVTSIQCRCASKSPYMGGTPSPEYPWSEMHERKSTAAKKTQRAAPLMSMASTITRVRHGERGAQKPRALDA